MRTRASRLFGSICGSSILPAVLVFFLLGGPSAAGDAVLERVEALAAAGAPRLALRVLDEAAAPAPEDPRWEAYERRRFELYRSLSDPAGLAARLEALPPEASSGLRRYATALLAEARLEAGDADAARELLATLLDQPPERERATLLARLAALELRQGRIKEAESLLERAGPAASEDAARLRAEIELRSGRPRAALARAAALASPEGRLLALAAALRAGARPPVEVIAEAQRLAQAAGAEPSLKRAAWLLRAEAARRAGQTVREVSSLEQALALPEGERHGYLSATGEDLWSAYRRLAEAVGRSAGLREGNAAAWLALARRYAPEEGYYARAVYAFVAQFAAMPAARETAQAALADSLLSAGLPGTLEALYAPAHAAVPAVVRQRLLDAALARGDFKQAVSLMDGLPTPAGEAAARWNLRRARVLLYAGYRHEALVLLSGLLDQPRFDEDFAAAYLQVVFDLQTLALHEEALVLLEAVYGRVDNARMRRELLYWQADSLTALGRHAEAAERYLRSASHAGASPSDPWGQAARFHAAEALGRARLYADARAIYASLLKQTADPARRAAIEQQMQQLWLAAQATTP